MDAVNQGHAFISLTIDEHSPSAFWAEVSTRPPQSLSDATWGMTRPHHESQLRSILNTYLLQLSDLPPDNDKRRLKAIATAIRQDMRGKSTSVRLDPSRREETIPWDFDVELRGGFVDLPTVGRRGRWGSIGSLAKLGSVLSLGVGLGVSAILYSLRNSVARSGDQ
jgi:hypothetical protein